MTEEDGKRSVDLAWAQAHLESVGFALQTRMLEGLPDAGIADEMQRHRIDLLVMGADGHSRVRNLMLGSTTTQLLRQAEGALLLHCGCASRMPSAACQPGRSTIATVVRVCVRAAEGRQAGRATSTRLRPARLAR